MITDVETGVTTQREIKEHALEMLEDALALHRSERESIETPEEEREALRELGIDPETARSRSAELPDVLK